MKAVVVIPSIREACLREFLEAWRAEFEDARVIVVEDNPVRSFRIREANVRHYAWEEIDATLGDHAWIIPRRTDCVRSFGYYMAWREKPDLIVTLDDDCFPHPEARGFLARHAERLENASEEAWVSTVEGVLPRGVPYFQRARSGPAILNHGLWSEVPDLDAPTQLQHARAPFEVRPIQQTIPRGRYYPMCGMNLAWRPEATPALYFLLMGRDHEYDRFGDIWAGIIVKRIADHLGWAVTSGEPRVVHRRASNVFANLQKEAPGLAVNEEFWRAVDAVRLSGTSFTACYLEIAAGLELEGPYWERLREAMRVWAGLFESEGACTQVESQAELAPSLR